jgi:hypothetical protein
MVTDTMTSYADRGLPRPRTSHGDGARGHQLRSRLSALGHARDDVGGAGQHERCHDARPRHGQLGPVARQRSEW